MVCVIEENLYDIKCLCVNKNKNTFVICLYLYRHLLY